MKSIPQKRCIIYLLLLGLVPLLSVFIWYGHRRDFISDLGERLGHNIEAVSSQVAREYTNHMTRKLYRGKDPFYLNKEVESLVLLQNEIDELKKLSASSFGPEEEMCRRRLHFLTSGENGISFTESSEKHFSNTSEVVATLAHPVQVNLADLRKILTRLEAVPLEGEIPLSRPHCIVSELRLEKKEGFLHEVFVLNLQVTRRDYGK
jgi:hypothetical protein